MLKLEDRRADRLEEEREAPEDGERPPNVDLECGDDGPLRLLRLESLRYIQRRLGELGGYGSTIRLLRSAEAPNDAASLQLLTILSVRQRDATESFLAL